MVLCNIQFLKVFPLYVFSQLEIAIYTLSPSVYSIPPIQSGTTEQIVKHLDDVVLHGWMYSDVSNSIASEWHIEAAEALLCGIA